MEESTIKNYKYFIDANKRFKTEVLYTKQCNHFGCLKIKLKITKLFEHIIRFLYEQDNLTDDEFNKHLEICTLVNQLKLAVENYTDTNKYSYNERIKFKQDILFIYNNLIDRIKITPIKITKNYDDIMDKLYKNYIEKIE
jgi:predicted RNase H-like nuclease